jgi:head-tail adaptor
MLAHEAAALDAIRETFSEAILYTGGGLALAEIMGIPAEGGSDVFPTEGSGLPLNRLMFEVAQDVFGGTPAPGDLIDRDGDELRVIAVRRRDEVQAWHLYVAASGLTGAEVALERREAGKGAYGAKSGAWSLLSHAWAEIAFVAVAEATDAAQRDATVRASFLVDANPATRSVTAADRLLWGGTEWNIIGAMPQGGSKVEILANRRLM